jgi:hypothetical protein
MASLKLTKKRKTVNTKSARRKPQGQRRPRPQVTPSQTTSRTGDPRSRRLSAGVTPSRGRTYRCIARRVDLTLQFALAPLRRRIDPLAHCRPRRGPGLLLSPRKFVKGRAWLSGPASRGERHRLILGVWTGSTRGSDSSAVPDGRPQAECVVRWTLRTSGRWHERLRMCCQSKY